MKNKDKIDKLYKELVENYHDKDGNYLIDGNALSLCDGIESIIGELITELAASIAQNYNDLKETKYGKDGEILKEPILVPRIEEKHIIEALKGLLYPFNNKPCLLIDYFLNKGVIK